MLLPATGSFRAACRFREMTLREVGILWRIRLCFDMIKAVSQKLADPHSELYPVGEQSWAQGFTAFPSLSESTLKWSDQCLVRSLWSASY